MSDHSRYYITGAFVLGAVVALGFQNIRQRDQDAVFANQSRKRRETISKQLKLNDLDIRDQNQENFGLTLKNGPGSIKEGIEGCIGDTPLIKIKSLSEATGCEILAKAEVNPY